MPGWKVKSQKSKVKSGFTLIELLVVITIIGILATFIVASFTSAQQKSRDAKRKSDLNAVKKALELAKGDCSSGSYYPAPAGSALTRFTPTITYLFNNGYIKFSSLTDPGGNAYFYFFSTNPTYWAANVCQNSTVNGVTQFTLVTTLENGNDQAGLESWNRCQSNATGGITSPYVAGSGAYYVCQD